MKTFRCLIGLLVLLALAPLDRAPAAQDGPKAGEFATYAAVFDEFTKRREVVLTKLDKLYRLKEPPVEDIRKAEDELRGVDLAYCEALSKYIKGHAGVADLEYARYELVVTLSRFEEKLDDAVKAADEFLVAHAKSELAPAIKFARAQSLFRIVGREADAIKALDGFIAEHPNVQEADFARMMRVRALLYANRVSDARQGLRDVLKLDHLKNDVDARAYIQRQLDDLDWIGRDLPKFALSDTEGNVLSSDDFKGKPLLVFVWDSTSGVCLEEITFVKALHEQHKDKMKVLGFSINESKPALEQWLKRNSTGFSNVWEDRTREGGFIKRLDVRNIPFNVLVDGEGKIFRYDVRSDDLMRYAGVLLGK